MGVNWPGAAPATTRTGDSGFRCEIRRTGHIAQARIRDKGLQVLTTRIPQQVDEVFVSNVAGASFATRLSGVVGAHCNCRVRFARSERSGWGVTNGYTQPRRMGVDRWVAMVGAWAEVQASCLVVDVGTAMTIDAIDDGGRHLGGQIIAGVATMADALATSTSDIPHVKPATGRTIRQPRFVRVPKTQSPAPSIEQFRSCNQMLMSRSSS